MTEHGLNTTGPSSLTVLNTDDVRMFTLAPTPNLITIKGENHEDLVKVQRDGSVIYGESVDLDEASRRFWDAIAANIPPTHRA